MSTEDIDASAIREYVEAVFIAVVLAIFVVTFIAQSFLVQGSSMEPTLHSHERLLVNKIVYKLKEPKKGDIVVFRYPMDPRRRFIKRVIGVGGDRIRITDGQVLLNGRKIRETYLVDPTSGEYGPVVVPKGRFFVLGDNRNNSEDSRFPDVGFIPKSALVGKAFVVYWPLGDASLLKAH